MDYKQKRPCQKLVAKDLHGVEWHFQHVFREMTGSLLRRAKKVISRGGASRRECRGTTRTPSAPFHPDSSDDHESNGTLIRLFRIDCNYGELIEYVKMVHGHLRMLSSDGNMFVNFEPNDGNIEANKRVFAIVMAPEHPERVRTQWFGVTPTRYFPQNTSTPGDNNSGSGFVRVARLEEELHTVKSDA